MSSAASDALSAQVLAQFTGSQTFYRHPLSGGCICTEGVQYVAETASAYWLLDAILCPQQHVAELRAAAFQVWTLRAALRPSHLVDRFPAQQSNALVCVSDTLPAERALTSQNMRAAGGIPSAAAFQSLQIKGGRHDCRHDDRVAA